MPARASENIAVQMPLVTLEFGATDIPDAAGNAFTVQPASLEFVMPYDGSVIGIGVASNAAFTTGVLTFQPTVNGTAQTGLQAVLSSTAQRATAKKDAGTVTFKAGERLGVSWTKTGTVAPLTNDVSIALYILLEGVVP